MTRAHAQRSKHNILRVTTRVNLNDMDPESCHIGVFNYMYQLSQSSESICEWLHMFYILERTLGEGGAPHAFWSLLATILDLIRGVPVFLKCLRIQWVF